MRLPHPRVAGVIMGVVSALAVGATWLGGLQLVYVAAFAVFAVFIGEMVRKDRSGNRLEQIAGTYVGCLIALSGAFWVVLVDRLHGGLAPVVAVCILSGSLGRYATGARFERVRRSGWLIAWLTFYAYIGGLVLVFVIGPPYLLKAFVWVFGVALIYGVVAGLTDLAARCLLVDRHLDAAATGPRKVIGGCRRGAHQLGIRQVARPADEAEDQKENKEGTDAGKPLAFACRPAFGREAPRSHARRLRGPVAKLCARRAPVSSALAGGSLRGISSLVESKNVGGLAAQARSPHGRLVRIERLRFLRLLAPLGRGSRLRCRHLLLEVSIGVDLGFTGVNLAARAERICGRRTHWGPPS